MDPMHLVVGASARQSLSDRSEQAFYDAHSAPAARLLRRALSRLKQAPRLVAATPKRPRFAVSHPAE